MKPDYKKNLISIILLIILGFAVYANSLNNEFFWDDQNLVTENRYIKSYSNTLKIFTEDTVSGGVYKYNFFRPLQIFSYMIDYSLFGLDVKGYHLINILLHILAALAVFWLINILFDNWIISSFTSLLFLVHPIHTEAVAYISGRADPLALLFMLLCLIAYIKHINTGSLAAFILMLLSCMLAFLSREGSLIIPGLLLLYHYAFKKKLRAAPFLSVLAVTFIYMLLRFKVVGGILFSGQISSATLLQRIPGFFVAIVKYIGLLILPFDLHMEYGNRLFNISDPKAIAGMVVLISLLVYAFRKRKSNVLAFFAIAWFIVTLIPVSNLYPLNAYMAEHWLYVPSIGFFLILAGMMSYLYSNKGLRVFTIMLIAALLSCYSFLTIKQNSYWRSPLVFYERMLSYAPDSARVYNNLGKAYYYNHKYERAIALYQKAAELEPDNAETYYNLGIVYNVLNKPEDAILEYKRAVVFNPDYAKAYNNMGNTYGVMGKYKEAIDAYNRAIEIDPDYEKAHYNLSIAYSLQGPQ